MKPWENRSGWRVGPDATLSRGEGAGVGGDAIGTYSVAKSGTIDVVDGYPETWSSHGPCGSQ